MAIQQQIQGLQQMLSEARQNVLPPRSSGVLGSSQSDNEAQSAYSKQEQSESSQAVSRKLPEASSEAQLVEARQDLQEARQQLSSSQANVAEMRTSAVLEVSQAQEELELAQDQLDGLQAASAEASSPTSEAVEPQEPDLFSNVSTSGNTQDDVAINQQQQQPSAAASGLHHTSEQSDGYHSTTAAEESQATSAEADLAESGTAEGWTSDALKVLPAAEELELAAEGSPPAQAHAESHEQWQDQDTDATFPFGSNSFAANASASSEIQETRAADDTGISQHQQQQSSAEADIAEMQTSAALQVAQAQGELAATQEQLQDQQAASAEGSPVARADVDLQEQSHNLNAEFLDPSSLDTPAANVAAFSEILQPRTTDGNAVDTDNSQQPGEQQQQQGGSAEADLAEMRISAVLQVSQAQEELDLAQDQLEDQQAGSAHLESHQQASFIEADTNGSRQDDGFINQQQQQQQQQQQMPASDGNWDELQAAQAEAMTSCSPKAEPTAASSADVQLQGANAGQEHESNRNMAAAPQSTSSAARTEVAAEGFNPKEAEVDNLHYLLQQAEASLSENEVSKAGMASELDALKAEQEMLQPSVEHGASRCTGSYAEAADGARQRSYPGSCKSSCSQGPVCPVPNNALGPRESPAPFSFFCEQSSNPAMYLHI